MGLWMQNVSNMTDLIYFRKSCIMSVVKIALNLSRLKTCIVSLGSVDHISTDIRYCKRAYQK